MQKKEESIPTMASIVTYNPDINRLKENLAALHNQVDSVIIIDNASNNVSEIETLLAAYSKNDKIVFIKNNTNRGLAAALNTALVTAKELSFQWLITMDQDSVLPEGYVLACKHFLIKYPKNKIGILSPRIIDRNNENEIATIDKNPEQEYAEIVSCITSGAFTNIDACLEFGGFDEDFFIDRIDFDLCINLRKHGFSTYVLNNQHLLHELGNISKHKMYFFKTKHTTNHSAERLYYIYRNSIKLRKKHNQIISEDQGLQFWIKGREKHLRKHVRNVLYFEKDKFRKLSAIVRGIIEGRKNESRA